MKKLKLFILIFTCILFSPSIDAVGSLQQLCTEQIAQRLVWDDIEEFRNNPNFIQENRLDTVPKNLKDQIKDAILKSYRPAENAQRLSDWIVSRSTITPITIPGHNYGKSIAWSPDGNYIATISNDYKTLKIWDLKNGLLYTLDHNDAIKSIAWSSDGNYIATGSMDRTAKIWNSQNGILLYTLDHNDAIDSVAWSPDDSRLATCSDNCTAKIWNTQNGALLHTLTGVLALAWSPDGSNLATGSSDGTAKIWNSRTATLLHTFPVTNKHLKISIAWSPDSSRLATSSLDRTAKIWDAQNGTPLYTLPVYNFLHYWLDTNHIATTCSLNKTARIWDIQNGTLLHKFPNTYNSDITSITWSPDGRHLAITSKDGTIKIWYPRTATTLLHTFPITKKYWRITPITWSPDGGSIATVSYNGKVRIFDLPQLTDLSLEQTLFLALIYNYYQNQKLILNSYEHLHTIYCSLPPVIQRAIAGNIRLLMRRPIKRKQPSEENYCLKRMKK